MLSSPESRRASGRQPLRIAIIADVDLSRVTGGVENHIRALTRELRLLGAEIATFTPGRSAQTRHPDNIRPLLWHGQLATAYARRLKSSLGNCRSAVRRIRSWRPDVVWQHDLTASWPATRVLARTLPIVLTNHTGEYLTLIGHAPGRWLLRYLLAHYEAVIGPSLELTPRWLGFRAQTIPNGVDLNIFQMPTVDRAALRRRLYGSNFSHVLFCPRRWAPTKGILFFAKALRLLESRGTIDPAATTVIFAGDVFHDYPAYYRQVQTVLSQCRSRIFRLGELPWHELVTHYQAADLVVIPSLYEAVSLAALEAMATATPVVASAAGGLKELIEDGVTGYLVRPRCETALADRIGHALADPLRCGIGWRARSVAETYSWPTIALRTLAVLGDAARRHVGGHRGVESDKSQVALVDVSPNRHDG